MIVNALYRQAVGVVSNLLLLTQLLVSAHMPLYAWSIVAAISVRPRLYPLFGTCSTASISTYNFHGRFHSYQYSIFMRILYILQTAGLTLAALRASLCESKGGRAILAFYSR